MSDAGTARPEAVPPSAGALLRQAREEAGLHVASLASILKVPQRQLEALEQDQLDLLPDVVYARALAASVCRNLKVDPRGILDRLPRGGDSRLGRDEPINLPFRPADAASSGVLAQLRGRPAMAVALVLVLAAALLLLLPQWPQEPPAATPGDATPASQAPAGAAVPGVVTESVQPGLAPGSSVPSVPAASAPAAAAAAASTPATVAPAAPSSASPVGAPLVEFRASQPSWVSVTDARGTVLLRRTLAAGEQVPINGVAPLAVTVGSASGVQVLVRGQPLQVQAARDNVARFEVR